jgi:hypothetical protein
VLVENDAESIASGLREAVEKHVRLVESAPAAEKLQRERWERQMRMLVQLIEAAS